MSTTALWRRLLAELVGIGLLVTTVVGSGVMAQLVGLVIGVGLPLALYPHVGEAADQVVVDHDEARFTSDEGSRS